MTHFIGILLTVWTLFCLQCGKLVGESISDNKCVETIDSVKLILHDKNK